MGPSGAVVNISVCDEVVREFELQSCFHFRMITLENV